MKKALSSTGNHNQEIRPKIFITTAMACMRSLACILAATPRVEEMKPTDIVVATRIASELIRIAANKMPALTVAAQTLPEENASTSILKKLQFRFVGTLEHPEDGLVWEWQLSNTSEA